jgi:acetoin utilization deacetylase AcuC-like enzyme
MERIMRVYFRDEMVAEKGSRFSPSPAKPKLVIEDWKKSFGDKIEIKKPWAVSRWDLYLAHDTKFVDGILEGRLPNGFGDAGQDVIDSLPFTVGAMICATKHAFKTGKNAAALCSGFHHAGHSSASSFCTFNGLVVAAMLARKAGSGKIGILDCDYHFGNGTKEIIERLHLDYVKHYTTGSLWTSPEQAETFLKQLPGIIKRLFYDCEALLYQAGADPYIEDPLGGFLTIEQLKKRDQIVFKTTKEMCLPVAWNLAGGYSDWVLEIHRNTAKTCIEGG